MAKPTIYAPRKGHLPCLNSLLWAQYVAKDPTFLFADSEDWSMSLQGSYVILLVLSKCSSIPGCNLQALDCANKSTNVLLEQAWKNNKYNSTRI